MKNIILVAVVLSFAITATAQKIMYKNETVYVKDKPFAFLKKLNRPSEFCTLQNLQHQDLISIHSGRIEIKGQPAYVISFLNDGQKGMVCRNRSFNSILKEIVKGGLIKDNAVDVAAEALFINTHPLPRGYTDIDDLNEYGSVYRQSLR